MKKILISLFSVFLSIYGIARDSQFDSTILKNQALLNLDQVEIMKNVHMIANMRYASNNNFANGSFQNSSFRMNELRMELVGKVTDKISFRLRDRYANPPVDPNTTDRLRFAVDLAYMEYQALPNLSITAGKMLSEWGSYEIDMNPVYMYAYNDMINYGDFFLSGFRVKWEAIKDHNFSFQMVNSNTRSFETFYGPVEGVEASKAPLGGTGNWRGKFLDGKFSTMWSYSFYNQAQGQYWRLLALGNQYKTSNLTIQYDFKYSNEDLDITGSMSSLANGMNPNSNGARLRNVNYMEHWIRAEYFITPRWSVTGMGMSNSAYWKGNPDTNPDRTDLVRTKWSFVAALEYHLFKPYNVKVFASYTGRYNHFTSYAREQGFSNNNTGQILFGVVSPLVLF